MQLVAVGGLVSSLAVLVCGPGLGRLVDTLPRLRVVAGAVVGQNITVSLSCLAVLACYHTVSSPPPPARRCTALAGAPASPHRHQPPSPNIPQPGLNPSLAVPYYPTQHPPPTQ